MPRKLETPVLSAIAGGVALGASIWATSALATPPPITSPAPWMNTALSPDQRADLLEQQMTPEEKHRLVFGQPGTARADRREPPPERSLGSAGFVPGVPRLGIPDQQETDAGIGVAWVHGARPQRKTTALPSGLATAATWDPKTGFAGGAMIGGEAHSNGFNVMLAGGVDLMREPRNGRNFEYGGEDPLLAGTMVGSQIAGIQSAHVVSTLKHYALNDQESGRMVVDSQISEKAARESDLLAFEIAAETGRPGSVMCSYNRINGTYACEHPFLLNKVLKGDWRWPGYVMSDWGAAHSTVAAANAGLDQESDYGFDDAPFFGDALTKAIADGQVPQARLDDMVHRILRSLFAVGAFDHPPTQTPIDFKADALVSRTDAERGAVLLKNDAGLLPLAASARRIAIIGAHADVGVLSGGGSSQVVPPEGIAATAGPTEWPGPAIYQASSPLKALQARLPNAQIRYADGEDVAAAAKLAAESDLVIVFADQWLGEAFDAPNLSLPHGQDALIAAVAKANPKTVVVLETGGPVLTPWRGQVGAILEAWYPGSAGGEAIARLLTGEAGPRGRLPVTFPESEAQLPRPQLDGLGVAGQGDKLPRFSANYDIEGPLVGYKWFEAKGLTPAYPFGFGLSYTRFAYSRLKVESQGDGLRVSFDVTNTGAAAGTDTPQVYVGVKPAGEVAHKRLAGWGQVTLAPGAVQHVTVEVPARQLAEWKQDRHDWRVPAGSYPVYVGASSRDLTLQASVAVNESRLAP